LPLPHAKGDEIRTRLGIIVARQPDRTPVVMLRVISRHDAPIMQFALFDAAQGSNKVDSTPTL
jgi:hypothetical protein